VRQMNVPQFACLPLFLIGLAGSLSSISPGPFESLRERVPGFLRSFLAQSGPAFSYWSDLRHGMCRSAALRASAT
jgi:hypothetical protein